MPAGSVTAFAPGRVTLFANDQEALSIAIDRGSTVRATPLPGPFVMVRAHDLRETDTFDLHQPAPAEGWRGIVRGTAAHLAWAGNRLRPARLGIAGTAPRGIGLGSSTSVAVAVALAMLDVAGAPTQDPVDLARLCHRVERDWAHTHTAPTDAAATLLARPGQAMRIHSETLSAEHLPFDLKGWTLAVVPAHGRRDASRAPGDAAVEAAVEDLRAGDIGALAARLGGRVMPGGGRLALFEPEVARPAGWIPLAAAGPARLLD